MNKSTKMLSKILLTGFLLVILNLSYANDDYDDGAIQGEESFQEQGFDEGYGAKPNFDQQNKPAFQESLVDSPESTNPEMDDDFEDGSDDRPSESEFDDMNEEGDE